MKLYGIPFSPNTFKVVALINQLGLKVEVIPVDPSTGFLQTAEFLAHNPNGLTPTLVDGDFSLWESNAILFYLANLAPESGLYPQDLKAKAAVHRWISWSEGHWGQAIRPYMFERMVKKMFRNEPPDEAAVAKAEPDFKKFAKVLDQYLSKHQYLVGDKLTIADFPVAAPLVYAQAAGLPLAEFPNVAAYAQRVLTTDAWKKAIPQMSPA
jgi:glutathione S-transferase